MDRSSTEMRLLISLQLLMVKGPKYVNQGICANIPFSHETEYLLRSVMIQWPHYSGRMTYPVPDRNGSSPSEAYLNSENMWDSTEPYGALRWGLLDFCITHLMKITLNVE